jgi:arylsulfate sulfotransferase
MSLRASPTFVLPILLSLSGCGDSASPVVQELSLTENSNPSVPLAASFYIRTDEPATVTFRIEGGGAEWTVDPRVGLALEHQIALLGLRVDTDHQIVAVATDASGNETAFEAIQFRTDPLPEDFPRFVLEHSDAERMEPGATLFNLMKWPEGGADDEFGAVVIVDQDGEVVWYYVADHDIGDARLLASGHLLYQSGRGGRALEVDMLGNVVAQWHATGTPKEAAGESVGVETETFHHEILEMPSGNLLTLSTEMRNYDEYPSSTFDPEAPNDFASVVGDVILEFKRDGRVQRELKLLDILDPYQTGSGSSLGGGFWAEIYGDIAEGTLIDWAHTNAVFFDPETNAFIFSSRVLDVVVKVDADSQEIVWMLGAHDRWIAPWSDYLLSPQGEFEWQNHQHAPMVTPRGTVLMFDNGTNRDGPVEQGAPASTKYSRAVEYEIDEAAMEVRQVWQYPGDTGEPFYSSFISDADWLPVTGNVLITSGGLIADSAGVTTEAESGRRSARIIEVTRESPAVSVFELTVEADWPVGGWHVYRAQRIPSLYAAPQR